MKDRHSHPRIRPFPSFLFLSGKPHLAQLPPKRILRSVRPSKFSSGIAAAFAAVSAPDLPKAIGVVQREGGKEGERANGGTAQESGQRWRRSGREGSGGRGKGAAVAAVAVAARPVWRIDKKSNTFTLACSLARSAGRPAGDDSTTELRQSPAPFPPSLPPCSVRAQPAPRPHALPTERASPALSP